MSVSLRRLRSARRERGTDLARPLGDALGGLQGKEYIDEMRRVPLTRPNMPPGERLLTAHNTQLLRNWERNRMDVKYQVFISSTYEDLQSARREVIEALMNLGHIPVGMENFQAGNQTQWEYIKKRIQQCDYYFVIVAERYGSEEPQSQKSYTRLEYEFAIDNGIPVAGFLLSDEARQSWPSQHVEHMKLEQINSF